MTTLLKLADVIDSITRLIGQVATALLIGLVALVFFNVAGRYVIGNAPVWMQELEWHLLLPIALLGITVLMLEKGHVRVDMLYDRFPTRTRSLIDMVSMLLGVMISVLFIKYSMGFVDSAFAVREGSPDPGGLPGRWLLKGFIPVAFGLLALQCLANAIRHAAEFTAGAQEVR